MNGTLSKEYSRVISSFYGVGGILRLSRFMDAFEKISKEAFDKAMVEVVQSERG